MTSYTDLEMEENEHRSPVRRFILPLSYAVVIVGKLLYVLSSLLKIVLQNSLHEFKTALVNACCKPKDTMCSSLSSPSCMPVTVLLSKKQRIRYDFNTLTTAAGPAGSFIPKGVSCLLLNLFEALFILTPEAKCINLFERRLWSTSWGEVVYLDENLLECNYTCTKGEGKQLKHKKFVSLYICSLVLIVPHWILMLSCL